MVFDGADLADVAATVGCPPAQVVDGVVVGRTRGGLRRLRPRVPLLDRPAPRARRRPPAGHTQDVGTGRLGGGSRRIRLGLPACDTGRLAPARPDSRVPLFDPDVPPHCLVAPGDRVRFRAVGGADFTDVVDRHPSVHSSVPSGPSLEVVEAGLATTVQDGGRRGCAHEGVPAAGAADTVALALANLLVGNRSDAAALECTASGPTLRVHGEGYLAVVGSGPGAVEDQGRRPPGTGRSGAPGGRRPGRPDRARPPLGLRAYVAVSGGLATPVLFGSRSSDTLAGLGPGPLRPGDRLARGHPARPRGRLIDAAAVIGRRPRPAVVAGPHGSPDDGLDRADVGGRPPRSTGSVCASTRATDHDSTPGDHGPRPRW